MRTIIHDLTKKQIKKFDVNKNDFLVSTIECNNSCMGCFSCWTKQPRKCCINDNFSNMVDLIKKSDELVIISKCRYGCYDYKIKRVLERCIGYVLPYFVVRNNEIHHQSRYKDRLKLSVYLYGNINDDDKIVIENLVKANSINLNVESYKVSYFKKYEEIKSCIY